MMKNEFLLTLKGATEFDEGDVCYQMLLNSDSWIPVGCPGEMHRIKGID